MIHINRKACIGCGRCRDVCSLSCIKMEEEKAVFGGEKRCITCGHCLAVCPGHAIGVDLYDNEQSVEMTSAKELASKEGLKNRMIFRRSVRSYRIEAPSKEEIEAVLDGARYAGTGGNRQALRYVAVRDNLRKDTGMAAQTLGLLSQSQGFYGPAYNRIYKESQKGNDVLFYNAPWLVLVVGNRKRGFNVNKDGCLAAAYIQLLGETMEIGSCVNGFFADAVKENAELRQELGIEEDEVLVCSIAMGYPAVAYLRSAPRKKLDVTWK